MNKEKETGLIPPFWGFSAFSPTIPKLYWDVKSQEQRILNLFDLLDKIICYADTLGVEINATKEEVELLRREVEELFDETSEFWKLFEKKLEAWINENMESLIQKATKMVFFGLTDTGYFCAYIPSSWSDITFDTGGDYDLSTYGRLILRYNVDGSGVIDNTGYGWSDEKYKELSEAVEKLKAECKDASDKAEEADATAKAVDGRVSTYDEKIETATTKASEAETKADSASVKVDSFDGRITTNSNDIVALNTQVQKNKIALETPFQEA